MLSEGASGTVAYLVPPLALSPLAPKVPELIVATLPLIESTEVAAFPTNVQ